ncbi:hypothetical protein TNCV_3054701 [Trichonephila clavipes]|nr:hypothetical protein TNCV_3054701 [Trichonephila clavipes]
MVADSDGENEMDNEAPVPTSSEMRNTMKSIGSYFDAHFNELCYGCIMRSFMCVIDEFRISEFFSKFRETRSFHVTRYDAGGRRAVRSPNLEEIILNVAADRLE